MIKLKLRPRPMNNLQFYDDSNNIRTTLNQYKKPLLKIIIPNKTEKPYEPRSPLGPPPPLIPNLIIEL
jgi:hypothetical protein